MKLRIFSRFLRISIALAMVLTLVPFVRPISASQANHVVISEVYGGGGNSGSTYKSDFVELYNPTSSAVDISGWKVSYASASGSTWSVSNTLPSGAVIQPGKYYLIEGAAGTGGTDLLPTADYTPTTLLSISSTGFAVKLEDQTATVIDLVSAN